MKRPSRDALAYAALAALLVALPPGASRAEEASRSALELSVGSFVPFDGDHNDTYGSAPWFGLGYSAGVGSGASRLGVETGLVHSSGDDFRSDPTFETGDAEYWFVPVILGIRSAADPRSEETRARFMFGVGIQWAATWWRGPLADASYAAAFGALLEVGPEFRLARNWDLCFRGRVTLLTDASYDHGARKINYSGGQIDVGIRRYLF